MKSRKVQYVKMPIKAKPYKHQSAAFEFVCRLFGLTEGGDANEPHQK